MSLEEYWRYEASDWTKINMTRTIEHKILILNYGNKIAEILWFKDKPYEEMVELLKDEKVVHGLTSNMIFPGGDWHAKTGKCLWGNTGGVMGRGEDLKKRLARFDIKIVE